MILARVIGNVWSTRKEESLRGLKFLVVQPVTLTYDEAGLPRLMEFGNSLVAADQIGAGEDEIVMVASGSSARQGLSNHNIPVDATIVGIIDKETFGA
ncbi:MULTISPECIES: EutN/CcmL family microcompartment protein [Desulfosporosinus]|uniref:EutN/CcmL family microcompartment protein n=1 Tax=Desulfosporosinus nitroreducens TaxID=2018668 RepID=A0ABT8QSC3_9FIRM|nr:MULTISPECIES: EutN/CcmL family microcompartment protein [Desulfosporosinus]MCB8817910.1 EutN/CcmL family microcompartment protein [Desulfosporosinus sp. SRJS8]MCO1604732.1 EutN/CcmL family microcompartment protein [Desulfosporosinus nitroreducens]MCO5386327.1 EutN/CcmL family microcompartment protein [Desulfosporosinus sp.]MDO0824246.1 EutN/CcmL family microcompartment protein [Desulfosporosinus nitroreducens]